MVTTIAVKDDSKFGPNGFVRGQPCEARTQNGHGRPSPRLLGVADGSHDVGSKQAFLHRRKS